MFKVGDKVRVTMPFWPSSPNDTGVIKNINHEDEWPIHVLMDFMKDDEDDENDQILNSFYPQELVKI